jgi:DNA-binding MarR family transcriptional regulator
MTTPSLFDLHPVPRLPFARGSDTSFDAAMKARHFVGEQGRQVLAYILGCGAAGCTQKDISEALFLGRPSVCARVNALEHAGEIRKTGARRDACAVYASVVYA